MADITVKNLAKVVGTTAEKLVLQLKDAGVKVKDESSSLSEADKMKLLAHLRESHGKAKVEISGPKKVTLKRRSVTELKQGRGRGKPTGTVSIEVRKKKTAGRSAEEIATGLSAEEIEAAKKAADEHEKLVAEKEQVREKEQSRLQKNKQDEFDKKVQAVADDDAKAQVKLELEQAEKEASTKPAEKPVAAAPSDAKSKDPARKADKKKGGGKSKPTFQGREKLHVASSRGGRRKKKPHRASSVRIEAGDEHGFNAPTEKITYEVEIAETIMVSELAQKMNIKAGEVIKVLMGLGTMATINQALDQDTAVIIVEEMGHTPVLKSADDIQEKMISEVVESGAEEMPRGPVVTIMGHVDHGKTSLLDYIRKSRVAAGESGGITQHIGAYRVKQGDSMVTFIDTPGHAAFTAMRARGAQMTDLVILVVAADDGVMQQTKEAVEHSRAAGVPMIVAVNKMDKEGVQPDKVKNELAAIEVTPEDWGGDTQFVHVSALTGDGVNELLEAIALQAELLELKAPVDAAAVGAVVESRLDKGRGAIATILVQKGTLRVGDYIVAGESHGRIKAMFDEHGKTVKEAGPSVPVEVLGLSSTTEAGVEVYGAKSERKVREIAEFRQNKTKLARQAKQQAAKLEQAFSQMEEGDVSVMNVVVKADVHGSLEALKDSLTQLSTDEVKVSIVASGVGGINESDVNLASASDAIIIGFNVRADASARRVIENRGVSVRYYSIIYDVIDDVRDALSGLLAPDIKEKIVGIADVRDVFHSPKLGAIAGCMVTEGFVKRDLPIRVLRESVVIFEGQLESLRRFKDDVQDVKSGMECGIGVKNYNDVKEGDQIEVFDRIEVKRKL
ncbi:MAG: translation initiation factor IF-2 [Cycloclasticus sp. symbiont of Poecilosclerida sp. M]|nr:MAG: translation initiation factor IF-2 [Cycloclasticus sp. symbiont of Poecilosclerida sp. M]